MCCAWPSLAWQVVLRCLCARGVLVQHGPGSPRVICCATQGQAAYEYTGDALTAGGARSASLSPAARAAGGGVSKLHALAEASVGALSVGGCESCGGLEGPICGVWHR